MNDDLMYILELTGSALFGSGIFFFLIRKYISSYLNKKGENLATKEDIEEITTIIESVKAVNIQSIEEIRSSNRLNLAAIEREKTLKKEVYLVAIEAITRSYNMILNFSDLDIETKQLNNNINKDTSLISRVHLVASESTVESVLKIMSLIGDSSLELLLDRQVFMIRKADIETLQQLRSESNKKISKLILILENLNSQNLLNTRQNDIIQHKLKEKELEVFNCSQEINNIWKLQNQELLIYSKKCMTHFLTILKLFPETILSIRRELDLKISQELYLEIFNENIKNAESIFDKFYNKINKEINLNNK